MEKLKSAIRNIPDFPKPGIEFKDITPLLADAACFRETIDAFKDRLMDKNIDLIVGVEARGFIFASALAYAMGTGTCMVRKPGKLPHTVHRQMYDLEYGTDTVEIHADAFHPNQRIVIFDDLLATGGTVSATAALIEKNFSAEIVEIDFLIELHSLNGRARLQNWPVFSLIQY